MKVEIGFERIGRNHSVPSLTVEVSSESYPLDEIAEAVHKHAGPHLGSRWYDVDVTADGVVLIGWGRSGRGQWREVVAAA